MELFKDKKEELNYFKKAAAIRYDQQKHRAPVITASGSGWLAERIITLAREHGVPVVEDRPLAELLRKLAPGAEIPVALYEAVASILAFIIETDRKLG